MTNSNGSKTVSELAAEIVSAYVSHNAVPSADLPSLVQAVQAVLIKPVQAPVENVPVVLRPAVPVNKSVTADYIVCLEDGKKFKSLKRHLGKLGLTPEKYREKWGLPSDYPMVAANYTRTRSELAKGMGLGRGGRGSMGSVEISTETASQGDVAEPAQPKSASKTAATSATVASPAKRWRTK